MGVDKSGESGIIEVEEIFDNKGENGILKLSSKFVNSNDRLFINAEKIKPLEGYSDVVIHGSPNEVFIEGNDGEVWKYTAKEVAEIIRGSNEYNGKPIRLISCQTGAEANGIAQQIADELGVDVLAPTEIVNVDLDGNIFLSDNGMLAYIWNVSSTEDRSKMKETGSWKLFKPRKQVYL